MLQSSTIKFLRDLKKNNNKPWFDAHRNDYDNARSDYAQFIQKVIDLQAKNDPSLRNVVAKDCLFRMNRDIRFSKDKTPYKTNFGASIKKEGKKAIHIPGYYFHLEPGNSFAGGGLYNPMSEELKKVRQEIDYNLARFNKIVGDKKFKNIFGKLDDSPESILSRVPKGYDKDHPGAAHLKLKSFIAMASLSDKDLTSPGLVKETVAAFNALQPLLSFLKDALND